MDLKELKKLIALFEKTKVTELEVESEGVRVKLRKDMEGKMVIPHEYVSHISHAKPPEEKTAPEPEEKLHQIVAPMVGTFYQAPSPDSPPYVEIGQEISEDDTVCIIEAMKIMNEIKAEAEGKIVKILAENGEPVEFGQPLFLVEPS